ncbi:hypothetical protein [Motiliproteus sp. MSK22-1]|uniref:hypothetical protein n=1 Tax=Motiliproteus sp. MSK22-1 TaxID=1897630 RepID=UPI0009785B81|nr:hypothetical protein [Motiliproteus sp. MSK22-1]OMH26591.1 hypothetical protein BGP75_23115 [Motiliproteus sp. MSK22-1]
MPFIHIKSLPFETAIDIQPVVEAITLDFAKGTDVAAEHVSATWEFFNAGHYAVAGKAPKYQPENSHPILVDLLAPDFHSKAHIEKMLSIVAESVSKRLGVSINNIFVNHRQAATGMVFDQGKVVRW